MSTPRTPVTSKYPAMIRQQQKVLAVLRIFLGLCVLFMASAKLSPGYTDHFATTIHQLVANQPFAFFGNFLQDVVLPDAAVFAYLLLMLELVVGFGLLLGMLTALAAVLGFALQLVYLFALAGQGVYAVGLHGVLAIATGAIAFSYAGTTWGIDRRLFDHVPYWLQSLLRYELREF